MTIESKQAAGATMINHKLRAARKQKRWTMAVAADKVGVTEQTYSFWENGKHIPHPSTLDLLCEAFEMPPEKLGFAHLVEEPVQEEISKVTPLAMSQPPLLTQSASVPLLSEEEVAAISSLLGGTMEHFDPSKRATLEKLLKIVGIATGDLLISPLRGLTQVGKLLHNEEILSISATHIPILWRLYFDGHLSEVERMLPDYLTLLLLKTLTCKSPHLSEKHWSISI